MKTQNTSNKQNKKFTKGFTLLELLVVVVIIGILAAIALPQYKKSVWCTRATNMLSTLRSMRTSVDVFYMVNGKYPTKLNELDITLDGYTKTCNALGPVYQTGGCKADDNLDLFINTSSGANSNFANPMFLFNKGPYKGAGFYIGQKTIRCYEYISLISEHGSFCNKVMKCTYANSTGNGYDYNCPNI